MDAAEIADLINKSSSATQEADEFAQYLSANFETMGHSRWKPSRDECVGLLAGYVASAIDWNLMLDPAAKADEAKLGAQPRGRIGTIQQLERIGDILGWDLVPGGKQPKLRDRPILGEVKNALEKEGVLGSMLVSFVEPPDGRQRKDLQFRPLAEKTVAGQDKMGQEEHDGTVFGFHDPSHLTSDDQSNARKLKRKFALASKAGAPATLRVDQVSWSLDDQPRQAIENADAFRGGTFVGLKSVRDQLEGKGKASARKNLAVTARGAARSLEIEFQMTDRNKDNQSQESIASWTKPYPFAGFGIAIFELLAPTRGGQSLNDILMPGGTRGDLKREAVDATLEGARHARNVLRILQGQLRGRGIQITGADLIDPDDADDDNLVPINAHYLDRGSPVMQVSENRRETTGRLDDGRRRVLERLWDLRDNSVKLRGFTELFHAYHEKLLNRGGNYGPLSNEMLEQIVTPTYDWYRELGARFEEGVAYNKDIKRRAGGLPNDVPEVPILLQHHEMGLVHYPELRTWGARRDDEVIEAILAALDPSGGAYSTWQAVTSIVDSDADAV